ncbi:MAG TPA: hypothetical protein VGF40_09495 [Thermoanaerobaculia bacterium]
MLIPLALRETPGAYGSRWITEFWVHNASNRAISFNDDVLWVNLFCVGIPCFQPEDLQAGHSRKVQLDTGLPSLGLYKARILGVRSEVADAIDFSLRIQDLSRSLLTWGTAIPVIRERDLTTRTLRFLDIPFTAPFRQSLRVYTLDRESAGCEEVDVRVFDLESGSTIWNFSLVLTDPTGVTCAVPSSAPNMAEMHNLSDQFVGVDRPSRVGIEVTPRNPALTSWGMVTVVNNETQHVTAIVPAK